MLGVVERAVADGCDDLTQDEERVTVEVVRRSPRHDNGTSKMEGGKDDGHDSAAEPVDVEAETDAEERVDKVRHGNLRKGEF